MKRISAENFFTEIELGQISRTVRQAEQRTSGEIATMIVDESDSYLEAELAAALFLAAVAALVLAVLSRQVTIWTYLPLLLLLFFPCRALLRRYPGLKLRFAANGRIVSAVKQRAVRAFYEKGLYRTRDETGILIFMSLLEHKVWILGDRGINRHIDPSVWQVMADELAQGIASGNGCAALCAVVARCGAELERHFPRETEDKNELTNRMLREDGPVSSGNGTDIS